MLKRVRVKMCGMTRAEDIAYGIELGIDALGFIFYDKSTRAITVEQARSLLHNSSPFVTHVAVLVNPKKDFVERILGELPIHMLQFHGDEEPDFCNSFGVPYIKVVHPSTEDQIRVKEEQFSGAHAILLDTPSTIMRGGTGQSFDWNIIPKKLEKPYLLAGGLNEFNIKQAISKTSPCAVDICSGIEAVPGIKDHVKMARFIAALWDVHNE